MAQTTSQKTAIGQLSALDAPASCRLRSESDHPYENGIQRSFTVEAPAEATTFRVHFDKIDTEARYDFVEVYDAAGTRVARWDGQRNDVTTPDISGRRATIKLVTDDSVTRWGFHVDAVQWRR